MLEAIFHLSLRSYQKQNVTRLVPISVGDAVVAIFSLPNSVTGPGSVVNGMIWDEFAVEWEWFFACVKR